MANADKFNIDFCNICGLKSNLNAVFSHLQNSSPDVLALSETQVFNNLDVDQFSYTGYNFEPAFFPHRGIGIYLKSNLVCKRLQHFEARSNEKFAFIWIQVRIDNKLKFLCFLYRSQELSSDKTWEELDYLTVTVDEILSQHQDAEIVFFGDFNVHNKNWLIFGIYTELFASLNLLTQLI